MTEIPIILLAAGESRRMRGPDKLMQEIDGVPLLRRSALAAHAAGPVIVALPTPPHPRYAALDGLDVLTVPISNPAEGMNASLRGALAWIPEGAPAVMVLLADLPDMTTTDLTGVLRSRVTHPDHLIWRGATQQGKPGHPVLFDRHLFSELSQLEGDAGAQSVVRAHQNQVHLHCLPGTNALLDLDTPEDWAQWHAIRSSQN